MDMTGEYRIPAPRQVVWDALNDVEVLKVSIPGCEELTQHSPTDLTAKVTAKVGPVKAKFNGQVHLEDLDPPNSYVLKGEGKGGPAGFAKGGAKVHLEEDGAETVLRYEAHADIGGKLAQLGSRLVQGAAKKTADDFFANFVAEVTRRQAVPAVAAAEAEAAAPAEAPREEAVPATAAARETAARVLGTGEGVPF
ncbi:MAG: CoxG family protein, partial [Pseudomonadota bacterium]